MARVTLLNRPLGGWTRLWIAVTALWLVVVGLGFWLLSDGPWRPYYVVAELSDHLDSAVRDRISDHELPNRIVTTPSGKVISLPGNTTLDEERRVVALKEERPADPWLVVKSEPIPQGNAGTPVGSIEFLARPVFYDPTFFRTTASLDDLRSKLQRGYEAELRSRRWSQAGWTAAIAVLPPIILFVFGLTVGWIFRGFRSKG